MFFTNIYNFFTKKSFGEDDWKHVPHHYFFQFIIYC